MRDRHNAWKGVVGRTLIAIGAALLVFYAAAVARTWGYQRAAQVNLERVVRSEDLPLINASASAKAARRLSIAPGELIGRVDIPRIKLSAAIAEGDDDKTLGKAVGHLPDTPFPWDKAGNSAFAAHRDGLFRPLEKIRANDDVHVITSRGEYHYRVVRTHIVDPDDVWVLAPTGRPTITLITCYPFSFVGHAPKRFVVQAELVGDVTGVALSGSHGG